MVSSIVTFFLDLLYPASCLRCERESSWLCDRCRALLPTAFHHERSTWSLLRFHDPWVMTALHMLKYSGASDLGTTFGLLLADRWRNHCGEVPPATVVTAIPLHKRRRRERGFNQAEIVARAFAKALGLRYARLLSRPKPTRSQATLGYDKRQKNIKGAFALRSRPGNLDKEAKLVFPLKTVILIDDVMTTGATLREASRVLHESGAETVHSLTVAYAPKLTRRVGRVA